MRCWNCFQETGADGVCEHCGYDFARGEEQYPLALKPGSILNGRYIMGRALGQGGFGITYLALDDQTGQRMAVKEFFPAGFASRGADGCTVQVNAEKQRGDYETGRRLFLEEAKTLATMLGSDHIVRIYRYFEENNTAYFVMEYVAGQPLHKVMAERGGRLTPEEALHLLLPLMEALEHVHAKGIVHRDISPDNILVSDDGTAKLIDFGAARYSTGEKSQSLDVIIKHGFAPYEQYMRRGRQGPWTDIYAFAATFYYALTGKVPPEAVERMDQDALLPPSKLGVTLGSGMESALLKALSVAAEDRFQDMRSFREALLNADAEEDTAPEAPPRGELPPAAAPGKNRRLNARKLVIAVAALAVVSVGTWFAVTRIVLPAKAYRDAQRLLNAGEYEQAGAAFAALGDYQDAAQQAKAAAAYQDAEVLLEAGQYAQAAEIFKRLGNYQDAPEQARAAMYQYAGSLAASGRHAEAAAVYDSLGDYLDSARMAELARAYLEAEALLKDRRLHKAYGAFAAIEEYSDAADRAREVAVLLRHSYGMSIAAGRTFTLALLTDGTVRAAGHNSYGECDVGDWTDIVAVSANYRNAAGLRSDGTVVTAGDNSFGQRDVEDWAEIAAISVGSSFIVGLREDGTVVAAGSNNFGQCNVEDWRDIIAIAAGGAHTVGLRADGTVVAVGEYLDGQCDLDDWTDIVAISASNNSNGTHTVGLQADGTVLAKGYNFYRQCNVSDWDDLISIAASGCHTQGVRADGTVLFAGEDKYSCNRVSDWSDVVAITGSSYHVVALKADGTMYASGDNRYGQCDVGSWTDVAVLQPALT